MLGHGGLRWAPEDAHPTLGLQVGMWPAKWQPFSLPDIRDACGYKPSPSVPVRWSSMRVRGLPDLAAGAQDTNTWVGSGMCSWHSGCWLGLCSFPAGGASLDLSCSTDCKLCKCRSYTRPIFIFSVASGVKFGIC